LLEPYVTGAFAVDGSSTAALGPALAGLGLAGKIPADRFDLVPGTLEATNSGLLDFTINPIAVTST
jgi:hypothetical protein